MERMSVLDSAAAFLGCQADEVDRKVLSVLDAVQKLQKELNQVRREMALRACDSLLDSVQDVQGVSVLTVRVDVAVDTDNLREMTDWFRDKMKSGVVVLGAIFDGKPSFVAAVTPDLVERGIHAGKLIQVVAQEVGGGGGGNPTLAQAGGRDAAHLEQALALVPDLVLKQLA
jgi:alanyl-tRNA synthetase